MKGHKPKPSNIKLESVVPPPNGTGVVLPTSVREAEDLKMLDALDAASFSIADMAFEYIYFVLLEKKPKTSVWVCRNTKSDAVLGRVAWHGPWRQYCFFPQTGDAQLIFSSGCLEDIHCFLKAVEYERKQRCGTNR